MGELELSETAQHWTNVVLIWVGFGILAGLLARVLVPGREPGGAVGTLAIGIVGSTLGPLLLSLLLGAEQFNPISPVGFFAAVAGAFVLLIAYRGLAACSHRKEDDPEEPLHDLP